MCKQFFYLRVSTQSRGENAEKEKEQTFERQLGILQRAGYELTGDNTFAERISGKTKADERVEFDKMLSLLQVGDWVIFTETSRFSRSYLLGMQMLDTLIYDKKVNVKFVSNGIELFADERMNPYTWYTVSQMLLADELQRRVISYNTINGLKRIKEQGEKTLGKPCTISEETKAEIRALKQSKSMTYQQIADKYGIHKNTVARI